MLCNSQIHSSKPALMIHYHGKSSSIQRMQRISVCNACVNTWAFLLRLHFLDQYDHQLLDDLVTRFPDTGLTKLVRGYRLYKENDIDQAFDLFAVRLDNKEKGIAVSDPHSRKEWMNARAVYSAINVFAGSTTTPRNMKQA